MKQEAWYDINGQRYARVTSILGVIRNPELETWRGRLGNAAANKTIRDASRVGTAVHGHIARYIAHGEPWKLSSRVPYGVKAALGAFKEYERLRGSFSPHPMVETLVWSERHMFAGTVDLWEPTVLTDWKTSGAMNESYWLQLAAYWLACLEQGLGSKITTLRIVRLDKVLGLFEVQERLVESIKPYLDAFLALREFYGTWESIKHLEEEADYDSSGSDGDAEGGAADKKDGSDKQVDRPEDSDARARGDRQERVLGARGEDPLSGM